MPSFRKKSSTAEEKKNDGGNASGSNGNVTADPTLSASEVNGNSNGKSQHEMEESVTVSEDENGVGGGGASQSESEVEPMGIVSDAARVAVTSEEGGHPIRDNDNDPQPQDSIMEDDNDDIDADTDALDNNNNNNNNTTTKSSCPKWSSVLSTPTTSPLFTPASDPNSIKSNLHGLALKSSVDRTKVLGRTGKNCSSLLHEIANLHEELVRELNKVCPSTLEQAAVGTPMEEFARNVNDCTSSFVDQTTNLGSCIRNDIAKPFLESSVHLMEEGLKEYSQYSGSRAKCAQSRKEALKSRKQYVNATKELDSSIVALRKARASAAKSRRKNKAAAAAEEEEKDSSNNREEGIEVNTYGGTNEASPTWEEELGAFGEKNDLTKWCEGVIKASSEVDVCQANYSLGVASENVAVDDCQGCERGALDSVQRLEEERIVFLIGLLDRFLQDTRESLENMSLDLTSTEPLDLSDNNHHTELPVSSATAANTPSSLFMSPIRDRRRAQSDDGPAINETRMLGLPDNIAETRDNMKSLSGRQLGRLKTLKLVAAFNEGLAGALESFGSGLKSQLEHNPSSHSMTKNEGGNVLNAWNATLALFEMNSRHAEVLSRRIREANNELQIILVTAEKEVKNYQEKEEFRWKSLCDAARVETKAKMKHKQFIADLEKARARLTDSDNGVSDGDSISNISPMKSTKMDRHMNKAMGKMFSILPGGGEDVMNKMLTPQQRQAISQRQLDEAKSKEEKGHESFEVAKSVKQQLIVLYQTETEAAECRCKFDEKREWDEMQNSLKGTVDAIRTFREGHMKSVQSSIEAIEGQLKGKALEDVASWTAYTQRRVEDQRARIVDDHSKQEEADSSPEEGTGFCLKVQLLECVEIKERIRTLLDEDDVNDAGDAIADDVDMDLGEDVAAELFPKEEDNDDKQEETKTSTPTPTEPLPDVPPDPFIDKMDPIFSKKLKNVSIDKYYSAGWCEDDVPLYGPWLEKKGSFDVSVTDWEKASEEDGDGGFENVWSGEKFPLKRTIKFKFKRTTHLYIGPPIAGVTQTQYLIKEGNDRCIVMMTVEMDGIPYSDVFAVEVRWSARRVNDRKDIAVDAGVFVRFNKSSMFASKIKSGTLKETSPIHLDLFEVIKMAIASGEEGGEIDEDIEEAKEQPEDKEEISTATVEVKTTGHAVVEVKATDHAVMAETPSQWEGILRQVVTAFSSLTQGQQLLLAFVFFFFITKMLFFRSKEDPKRAESMEDLARKVDDLTNEVREMKIMLESILKLSEQS